MNMMKRLAMTGTVLAGTLLLLGVSSNVAIDSGKSEKDITAMAIQMTDFPTSLTAEATAEAAADLDTGTTDFVTGLAADLTAGLTSGFGAGLPDNVSGEKEDESEYANLAIAHVTNYVNVRTEPTTESSIIGKIPNGAVATVLEIAGNENDWFKITSGKVEGYIKSEYFYYGEEASAVIEDYITRYAVVLADRLNVREQPEITSKRIGYIDNGEKAKIVDCQGEWVQVQYGQKTGYVASEYITVTEEFAYAKTLEEILAEEEARRKLEERAKASETQASENTTITVRPPSNNYASNSELRSAIVDYSMQFLGNKYVHGGNSLVTGTDCSGFTSLIYAEFGYALSRTPAGQLSGAGRGIDYSEIQPGDIICYGKSKCTHVALYIGDGQIIHAANSKKGVVIYEADYDNILGVRNVID